jgi:hypothetical protein
MSYQLHIGDEDENRIKAVEKAVPTSAYLLDLTALDQDKKESAHENVTLDLKQEIKTSHKESGRICIIGERQLAKKGLGRIPMVLASVLMIVILNLGQIFFLGQQTGEEALALAGEAFTELQAAGQAMLSGEEGADSILFQEAENTLLELEEQVSFLIGPSNPWLEEPKMIQSLRHLLEAGKGVTSLGQSLAEIKTSATNLPEEGSLTDYLAAVSTQHIEPAHEQLKNIISSLELVDLSSKAYPDSIRQYQSTLSQILTQLITIEEGFQMWKNAKSPLLTALGDDLIQDYLILLGNNDEMRLGGPFIGSIAWVRFNDGRLDKMEFSDVYTYDNRLFEDIDIPVRELQDLVTPGKWRLRDSLTSLDFPTSAQNALMFAEKENLPTSYDGVFLINLSAAQALLETLGPISVEGLNQPLTAETFPVVMSALVEAKVNPDAPKEILGSFIEAFMSTLKNTNSSDQIEILLTLLDQANKKQILAYHTNPEIQSLIDEMGFSGAIPQLGSIEDDFLATTFVNIGGNKTDRYMETELKHQTHIFEDGSMVNALTINRTHTFTDETMTWIKSTLADFGFTEWNETLEAIQGNSPNQTGMRIYLPEGAQILEVSGDALRNDIQFYYDVEQDNSYYYLDQTTQTGQSKSVTLFYSLPWPFTSNDFEEYRFQLFKQPGLKNISFEKTVTAPGDILLSSFPLPNLSIDTADYSLSGPLDNDLEMILMYR